MNYPIPLGPFRFKLRWSEPLAYKGPAMYFQDGNSAKFYTRYLKYKVWLKNQQDGEKMFPVTIYGSVAQEILSPRGGTHTQQT